MHALRKFKLEKLNEGGLVSFYWLGFLLADGHFYNNGRVKITLSVKDEGHLEKFIDFIGHGKIRKYGNVCEVSIMDVHNSKVLMEKYKINSFKTISPPDLSHLTHEELLATSIGFIDGDGHIRRQLGREGAIVCVKVHSSWLETLSILFKDTRPFLQNSGYAFLSISEHKKVKELKIFSLSNGLPIMQRKWDLVNLDFTSKLERSNERLPIITEMLREGTSQKEIACILNMGKSNLSQLIKRHKLRG